MTTAPEFGNGTTIAFGTSGFSAEVRKLSFSGRERAEVDVSHLGSDAAGAGKFGGAVWKPGKLLQAGQVSMEYHFDGDTRPLVMEVAETITITYPLSSGEATATIWAGSGYVVSEDGPEIENDVIQVGTMTIRMTGDWTITQAA